ncbi:hypothetical protein ACJX0J_009698, partial [Zea mays]
SCYFFSSLMNYVHDMLRDQSQSVTMITVLFAFQNLINHLHLQLDQHVGLEINFDFFHGLHFY